jgi:hypothetical protein
MGMPMVPFMGFAAAPESPPDIFMLIARAVGTDRIAGSKGKKGVALIGMPLTTGLTAQDHLEAAAAKDGWKLEGREKPRFTARIKFGKKFYDFYVLRDGVAVPTRPDVVTTTPAYLINNVPGTDDVRISRELFYLRDVGAEEVRAKAAGRIPAKVPRPEALVLERAPSREMAMEEEAVRQFEEKPSLTEDVEIPGATPRYEREEKVTAAPEEEVAPGEEVAASDLIDEAWRSAYESGALEPRDFESETSEPGLVPETEVIDTEYRPEELQRYVVPERVSQERYIPATEAPRIPIKALKYRTWTGEELSARELAQRLQSPAWRARTEAARKKADAVLEKARQEQAVRERFERQDKERRRALLMEKKAAASKSPEEQVRMLEKAETENASKYDITSITRERESEEESGEQDVVRLWPDESASPAKLAKATHLLYSARTSMPKYLKRGTTRYVRRTGPTGKVEYVRSDLPLDAPLRGLPRGFLRGLGMDIEEDGETVAAPPPPPRSFMLRRGGEAIPAVVAAQAPVVLERGTIEPVVMEREVQVEPARVELPAAFPSEPAFGPHALPKRKLRSALTYASDLRPFLKYQLAGRTILRVYRGTGRFIYPVRFNDTTPDGKNLNFVQTRTDEVDENGVLYKVYVAENPNFVAAPTPKVQASTITPKKREVRTFDYPAQSIYEANKTTINELSVLRQVLAKENAEQVAKGLPPKPIPDMPFGKDMRKLQFPLTDPWDASNTYASVLPVREAGLVSLSPDGVREAMPIQRGEFIHQSRSATISFDGWTEVGLLKVRLLVADVRAMGDDVSVPVEWGRKGLDFRGRLVFSPSMAWALKAWMGKLANERLGKLNGLGESATCFRLFHGSPASGLDLTGYAKPLFFTEDRRVAAAYAKRQVVGTSNVIGTTPTVYVVEVCPTKLLDTRMPAHLELANERLQSDQSDPEDRPRIDFDWGTRGSTGFPVHSLRLPLLKVLPDFDAFYIDEGTQGWSVMVRPGAGNFRVVGVEPA